MDFFYVSTYVNGFTPGLQNAFVGGYVKPLKGLKIGLDYHYLATATKLHQIDMTLGHEIELRASYQLMKDASLSMAYSYMTGTETMERLKRASNDGSLRWGWISLNVSPRIFSTKW
jgi:predicted porin